MRYTSAGTGGNFLPAVCLSLTQRSRQPQPWIAHPVALPLVLRDLAEDELEAARCDALQARVVQHARHGVRLAAAALAVGKDGGWGRGQGDGGRPVERRPVHGVSRSMDSTPPQPLGGGGAETGFRFRVAWAWERSPPLKGIKYAVWSHLYPPKDVNAHFLNQIESLPTPWEI